MGFFGPNIKRLQSQRNVEGLIRALDYNKEASVRQAATMALGELKDPRAVEPLIAALKDSDKNVRWEAANALGEIKDPRSVELLMVRSQG